MDETTETTDPPQEAATTTPPAPSDPNGAEAVTTPPESAEGDTGDSAAGEATRGGDASLISILRQAMGDKQGIEIRWAREE